MIEISRERQAQFDADSRRRAEVRGALHERVDLARVLTKTAGRCYLCHVILTADTFWPDHRKPLGRGGWHSLENVWPACKVCNRRKGMRYQSDLDPNLVRTIQDTLYFDYGVDAPRARPIGVNGVIEAPQCWTLVLATSARDGELVMRLGSVLTRAIGRPVACVDVDGVAGVVGIRIPRQAPLAVPLRMMPPARGLEVPLGLDAWGRVSWLNLAHPTTPHLLIAGASGGGKSGALRAAVRALALGNAPSRLRIALADPSGKMRALAPLAGLAHLLWMPAENPADTRAMIQAFEKELRRRGQENDLTAPPWILVIDELPSLRDAAALDVLATLGREMGLRVFGVMQAERAADIDPRYAGQFGARLCMRVAPNDTWTSSAMLGTTAARHLRHAGQGLLYTPTALTEITVAYASDGDEAWTGPAWQAVQSDHGPEQIALGEDAQASRSGRNCPKPPPEGVVAWVREVCSDEGRLPGINRLARWAGVGNSVATRWLNELAVHPTILDSSASG